MRVLIIDDEQLAINTLENKLKKFPQIEVVKTFTNVTDFLEEWSNLDCDAVFLDIQMPRINGLQLATIIKEQNNQTQLIFVTAYRKYSLEAFEFPSLDYLVKPISPARLEKAIARLEKTMQNVLPIASQQTVETQLSLTCFGKFALYKNNEIVSWKSEKVRELFTYFVLHQGQPIHPEFLMEILWPYFDLARGKANLHTNISMLRKFLNTLQIPYELTLINRTYIFKVSALHSDYYELYQQFDRLFVQQEPPTYAQAQKAIQLYKKGLLVEEGYEWLYTLQADIESKMDCYLQATLSGLTSSEKMRFYPEFLQVFPLNEKVVKEYIKLLKQQELSAEALKVYVSYRDALQEELQVAPSFTL